MHVDIYNCEQLEMVENEKTSLFASASKVPTECGQLPAATTEEEAHFYDSLERFFVALQSNNQNGPNTATQLSAGHSLALYDDGTSALPKVPRHKGVPLNLARLYKEVCSRGGYDEVCSKRQWAEVFRASVGSDADGPHSNLAKHAYERCLLDYERTFFLPFASMHKEQLSQQQSASNLQANGTTATSVSSVQPLQRSGSYEQQLFNALEPSTGPIASLSLPRGAGEHSLRCLLRRLDAHTSISEALNALVLWTFDGVPEHLAAESSDRILAFAARCVMHDNGWSVDECYQHVHDDVIAGSAPERSIQWQQSLGVRGSKRKRFSEHASYNSDLHEARSMDRLLETCFEMGAENDKVGREAEAAVTCVRNIFFTVQNPADLLPALGRHASVLIADERTLSDCLDCLRAAFPYTDGDSLTLPLLAGLSLALKASIRAALPFANCTAPTEMELNMTEDLQLEVLAICSHCMGNVHPHHLDDDQPFGDPQLIEDVTFLSLYTGQMQVACEASAVAAVLCKRSQSGSARIGANARLLRQLLSALHTEQSVPDGSTGLDDNLQANLAEVLYYASKSVSAGSALRVLHAWEAAIAQLAASRSSCHSLAAKTLHMIVQHEHN